MTDVLDLARRVEQSTSPFGCCTWEEARHLACEVLDLRAKVATVELERDGALERQRRAEEERDEAVHDRRYAEGVIEALKKVEDRP
jgi:hypothetical protein